MGATGAAGKEVSDEDHETGREHQNTIVCKQSNLTREMKAITKAVDMIVEFKRYFPWFQISVNRLSC